MGLRVWVRAGWVGFGEDDWALGCLQTGCSRLTLLCHWISHALKTSRSGGIKLDLIAPIGNIVCFCS
ncbi:hypothetical protein Hanom_Chr12g01146121 [Helianthus anomalus]